MNESKGIDYMKMRNRLAILTFAILAASLAVLAQSAGTKKSSGDLTAEQIIAKNIEASGGKAAMDKVKTSVTKANIDVVGQGITGTSEEYQKAPNKVLSVVKLSGIGDIMEGYDGQIAWENSPFQGLREKSGSELEFVKRSAATDSETNWKKYYKSAELTGTEKVGDSDTYVVKFIPAEGEPIVKYIDKSSFLLVRLDAAVETPQGVTTSKSYFSDFRAVDGVKYPFDIKLEQGPANIHVTITEVKHNVDIDDAKFKKPAN
jgi:hypothetical protein